MYLYLCFSTQNIAKPLTDMEKAKVVIAHKGNDMIKLMIIYYIYIINQVYK